MAITKYVGGLWHPFPCQPGNQAPTLTIQTIDAAGEKVAFIFVIPRTGTLDTFEWRIGAVSNNPDNGLRISFQDLDASGNPDGTQDQFRTMAGPFTANTWQIPGLITSDGTDGGTKRSVTAGQRIAVVIEFESFVAADSVSISTLSVGSADSEMPDGFNTYVELFTAAWAEQTLQWPLGVLKYATDGYVPIDDFNYPALTMNTRTFNNTSTPDEIALRFQVPTKVECDGAWVRGDFDGDVDIVLYDSDGSTVLASATMVAASRKTTTGGNFICRWAPVTLLAATTYRLSFKPTSATNASLYTFTANSAGLMAAAAGGSEWYRSERTDAGAWTQTTTERPYMGLHFSGVDVTAGGGGEVAAAYLG